MLPEFCEDSLTLLFMQFILLQDIACGLIVISETWLEKARGKP